MQIPSLATPSVQCLELLEKKFSSEQDKIENWFQKKWQQLQPPVYGSVDLRNAGFKLAPVDMNLFPAGFNNLNPSILEIAMKVWQETILKNAPEARKILLIPENHTRSVFYWESIQVLLKILSGAGFEVKIGTLIPTEKNTVTTQDGTLIELNLITRKENKLLIDSYEADVILLNNDLSEGVPDILKNLQQPILPPAELGWSNRLKSTHFKYYSEIANEFATHLEIDPWMIDPLFEHCGEIDFMKREGEELLAQHVETLFKKIKTKYQEYNIAHAPYVVVKADAGTYGMAVMMIKEVDEIRGLNRKQRTKMSATKGGNPVTRVIIQEGVYTFETMGEDNSVAEPVVYLFGKCVIGGFYRVHKDKNIDENLNAPGMHFEPLPFAHPCQSLSKNVKEPVNRFYAYGVIARLSMLAAAKEMAGI